MIGADEFKILQFLIISKKFRHLNEIERKNIRLKGALKNLISLGIVKSVNEYYKLNDRNPLLKDIIEMGDKQVDNVNKTTGIDLTHKENKTFLKHSKPRKSEERRLLKQHKHITEQLKNSKK